MILYKSCLHGLHVTLAESAARTLECLPPLHRGPTRLFDAVGLQKRIAIDRLTAGRHLSEAGPPRGQVSPAGEVISVIGGRLRQTDTRRRRRPRAPLDL